MGTTPPPPLGLDEVERRIGAREARGPARTSLEQRFYVVAGDRPPKVSTSVSRAGGRDGVYEIVVELEGVHVGERAAPPPLAGKAFRKGLPHTGRDDLLTAFVPDHLGVDVLPRQVAKGRRTVFETAGSKIRRPTTVFAPDDRRLFRDTSYPWSTVGVVDTPHGSGSGVMIGPRHLLTVSHVIDWVVGPPFAADWVKFTPSSYDGDEPFGHAYGSHIYWFNKDNGDNTIDATEGQFDYVVVVLDSRLGESTGWMGARGYTDSWDGLEVWSHMGYPGDLNSGQRPSFQGSFPLDGTSDPDEHEAIEHTADVFPGQSGGPVFGWWDGDVGPRAVAVQSWQSSDTNGASGGSDLRELVIRARTDFA